MIIITNTNSAKFQSPAGNARNKVGGFGRHGWIFKGHRPHRQQVEGQKNGGVLRIVLWKHRNCRLFIKKCHTADFQDFEMRVIAADLLKGLDWDTRVPQCQVMDSEFFYSDQQQWFQLHSNVIVQHIANFQSAQRMIWVVLAQIGNASTERFDDAAIVLRRDLVAMKRDRQIRKSGGGFQGHDELIDKELF